MTLYVLDTDMLTLLEEGHPAVGRRFLEHSPDATAITVLTVEEQLSGWYSQLRKAKRPARLAWAYRRLADTVSFLANLRILTYDEQAMRRYEDFRAAKVKVGPTDLRIAAVVLGHEAILVTRNARDFRKVPGLQFEDWSSWSERFPGTTGRVNPGRRPRLIAHPCTTLTPAHAQGFINTL
jgi:tRNA(fMet)-specific endonuclease VapC